MTTKKLLITTFAILGALVLFVALFVGGIVGLAFYTLGHSEAASAAKRFLKQNEKLKEDIGEVQDFGSFVSGSINTENSDGVATLRLKAIGARRSANTTVSLVYTQGGQWRVTDATYLNEAGQTVYLLDKYNNSPP
jgi:autotransporter translocation and assembly factor TamB